MVPLCLVPALALLFFYVSTFRSMCVVPNMAVFCSSLTSWFPGMSLTYYYCYYYHYYYYYYYWNYNKSSQNTTVYSVVFNCLLRPKGRLMVEHKNKIICTLNYMELRFPQLTVCIVTWVYITWEE